MDRKIKKFFRIKENDNLPFKARRGKRNDLIKFFAQENLKVGAEVGVHKGDFSLLMCKTIPGVKLYCIDSWEAPYYRVSQEMQDKFYKETQNKLSKYNAIIIKNTSMSALDSIEDNELDFVYIDGGHDFDTVMSDIIFWSKKVKKGGIVSGHDFKHTYQYGVVQAVSAYTTSHNITDWYITRDGSPSFFWVNK